MMLWSPCQRDVLCGCWPGWVAAERPGNKCSPFLVYIVFDGLIILLNFSLTWSFFLEVPALQSSCPRCPLWCCRRDRWRASARRTGTRRPPLGSGSTKYKLQEDQRQWWQFQNEILTYPSRIVIQPYYCSSGSAWSWCSRRWGGRRGWCSSTPRSTSKRNQLFPWLTTNSEKLIKTHFVSSQEHPFGQKAFEEEREERTMIINDNPLLDPTCFAELSILVAMVSLSWSWSWSLSKAKHHQQCLRPSLLCEVKTSKDLRNYVCKR